MSYNNPYNQLDSAYSNEMTTEEGNLQAMATAKKKSGEALYEGLGSGVIAPAGLNLLRKGGKKIIGKIAGKVAPELEDAGNQLGSGDVSGAIKTVGKKIVNKVGSKVGQLLGRGKQSLNDIATQGENKVNSIRSSVDNITPRPTTGSTGTNGLATQSQTLDDTGYGDIDDDFIPPTQPPTNPNLPNQPNQPNQPKPTQQNKPAPDDDEETFDGFGDDLEDTEKIVKTGTKVGSSIETMTEIDSAGGFDPIADVIGLVAGGLTLALGLSHADKPKPPPKPTNISLPNYQLGVN